MTNQALSHTGSGKPAVQRLGRFELGRVLGQGAQATVWLAHDARLQRDVALKWFTHSDTGTTPRWLQEARHIGRMVHPNIVTLYEADVYEGHPALAMEYVAGPTLAQKIRDEGAMDEAATVNLILQVLDALQHAHQAQVVHRDLKPSNLLIDASGHLKVTDFGIASPLRNGSGEANAGVEGTPGYIAPEVAAGGPARPVNDVFSAALVLAEMLLGHRLVDTSDPAQAVSRVMREDLLLPVAAQQPIDDALRTVIQHALARDPANRYPDAASFAAALRQWQTQRETLNPPVPEANNSATLEFLLRRMRRNSDFPAMSEQMMRVQRMAGSDTEPLDNLTTEILKDVALTNKLLRIVNSASYSHVGAGSISTVSRAVSLLGFAGVRNLAMSLVLLDHMENQAHADQLKGEYLRALLAGSLGAELAQGLRGQEEVFLGGMFQNLGRLLNEFYLPDEARQIRDTAGQNGQNEQSAAESVLGLSLEALGLGVARAWGLPEGMRRLMRRPGAPPPNTAATLPQAQLQWITVAANDMASVFKGYEPSEWPEQLRQAARRFAPALGMDVEHMHQLALKARDQLQDTAGAIGLKVSPKSAAARMLRPSGATHMAATSATDAMEGMRLRANSPSAADDPTQVTGPPASAAAASTAQPPDRDQVARTCAMLTLGVQDVALVLTDNFKLPEVLRMVLESMYRALACQQAIFVLKEPKTGLMVGRFGLGDRVSEAVKLFQFDPKDPHNLFSAVCSKGLDALIHDATERHVRRGLPSWYAVAIQSSAFLLLPLQLKGSTVGLIYLGMAPGEQIALDDKGLALLKTLRNQAVMAIRQSQSR
jgi:serine/threonine protein kinase